MLLNYLILEVQPLHILIVKKFAFLSSLEIPLHIAKGAAYVSLLVYFVLIYNLGEMQAADGNADVYPYIIGAGTGHTVVKKASFDALSG